jgi:hypothetical protein
MDSAFISRRNCASIFARSGDWNQPAIPERIPGSRFFLGMTDIERRIFTEVQIDRPDFGPAVRPL